MLSRALVRAAALPRTFIVSARPISTTLAKNNQEHEIFANEKGPERDLVNFPRRTRPIEISPVRHKWIPEEYFTFFYEKTGVTGPYMFAASFLTYLLSKEIWVIEHDFFAGGAVILIIAGIAKKIGPDVSAYLDKQLTEEENAIKSIRQGEIDRCKDAIKDEETAQWMAGSYETLIEAKKENVALQLEAEYRQRLHDAYQQVKKRLDYQLQVTNVMRRAEQKHMVDWILSNVRKSITAKQEEDALKKCLADLKLLAK